MHRTIYSLLVVWFGVGCTDTGSKRPKWTPQPTTVTYVGTQVCEGCHEAESKAWRGSHHDRSMETPSADGVLANFAGGEFRRGGATTRFLTEGTGSTTRYVVETPGPSGKIERYEVAYTFGFDPLQQYLLKFPNGRLQALSIAWDSRPKEEGGHRFYSVHGEEALQPDDPQHWTQPSHTWNRMCVECHSTGARKGYDRTEDSYNTTYESEDVGCEACHGPGSKHVQWAESAKRAESTEKVGDIVALAERRGVSWRWDPQEKKPRRVGPEREREELDVCASCHSRRRALDSEYAPGKAYFDHFEPSFLTREVYHHDGQIDGEAYVYGSFLQSKMYGAGVTCSDCHEPHSQRLRATGSSLCTQCHDGATYDVFSHHRHPPKASVTCADCHMGSKVYMGVDRRHDHSFRVPRPVLSASLKTPTTCVSCHDERSSAWSANTLGRWYGTGASPTSDAGTAFAAVDVPALDARARLLAVVENSAEPAVVRATALALMPRLPSVRYDAMINRAAQSSDDWLRYGAARASTQGTPFVTPKAAVVLIKDRRRAIRSAAVAQLQRSPGTIRGAKGAAYDRALSDYRASLSYNADHPDALVELARIAHNESKSDKAKSLLELAVQRFPRDIPAVTNLADLLRAQGDEEGARRTLGEAIERIPLSPELHQSLGLAMARAGKRHEALEHLRQGYELANHGAGAAYLYAMALHSEGRVSQSIKILTRAQQEHPADRRLLESLMGIHADQGDTEAARRYQETINSLNGTR